MGMPVSFHDPFPIIVIDDRARVTRLYRDLLGFNESHRFPSEQDSEPGSSC